MGSALLGSACGGDRHADPPPPEEAPSTGGQAQGGRTASGGAETRGGTAEPATSGSSAGPAGAAGQAPEAETAIELPECDPNTTPNFDGPPHITVESLPQAAVTGDWNGDRRLDLATANGDGSVGVVLGKGDGSLLPSVRYVTDAVTLNPRSGDYPNAIARGDLDSDGAEDLVSLGVMSPELAVLRGNGDGTFTPSGVYELDGHPLALALGDWDEDGALDIAVTVTDFDMPSGLLLLSGLGDGTLASPERVRDFDAVAGHLAAADLNLDSHADLVVIRQDETLSVLLGEGDGTFADYGEHETSPFAGTVAIGDFDGDDLPDLAAGLPCDASGVDLFLGDGLGGFAQRRTTPATHRSGTAIAGDVDGDGMLDVVGSARSTLLGSGEGSFSEVLGKGTVGGDLLALADFDGDGRLDVATAEFRWLAVRLGNGDGTFGSVRELATEIDTSRPVLEDLDGDGLLDLAINQDLRDSGGTIGSVAVYLGTEDGGFAAPTQNPIGGYARGLAAADLNGDRVPDLVATSNAEDSLSIFLGNGDGSFAPAAGYAAGSEPFGLGIADLNDDSAGDLVLTNAFPDPGVSTFLGRGDGSFASRTVLAMDGEPFGVVLLQADANETLDAVVARHSGHELSLLLGNGRGSFAPQDLFEHVAFPMHLSAADFDGDATDDFVFSGDNGIRVALGTGRGEFELGPLYQAPSGQNLVADFDGDGALDVFVHGSPVHVLFGTGTGEFSCVRRYAVGGGLVWSAVADVNRDGRPDLVGTTSQRSNIDRLAILLNLP